MTPPRRTSSARWTPAGLGVVVAVVLTMSGCSLFIESGPAIETSSPAPGETVTLPTFAGEGNTGELVLAATADDRHSWITAEARVKGVTQSGTCEYTASAEGVDTITRTAKALPSNSDTVCGDISFELGTPGTYTITVSISGLTDEPLTASTEVEFLGASAD